MRRPVTLSDSDRLNAATRDLVSHAPLRAQEILALIEYRRGVPAQDRARIESDGESVALPRSGVEISALRRASVSVAQADRLAIRSANARIDALARDTDIPLPTGSHPLRSAMDSGSVPYAGASRVHATEILSATYAPYLGDTDRSTLSARLHRAARSASQDRLAGSQRAIAHADRLDSEDIWRLPHNDVGSVTGQPMATLGYGPASEDPEYMGPESESLLDPTHTCGCHRAVVLETPALLASVGWTNATHTVAGGYGRPIAIVARDASRYRQPIAIVVRKPEKPEKPGKRRKRGKRGAKRR